MQETPQVMARYFNKNFVTNFFIILGIFGLDRITNANDITLSLESSYRKIDSLKEDKDLLNLKIAQSYFSDNG